MPWQLLARSARNCSSWRVIARRTRLSEFCERVVRETFVDGAVTRLPYLGALRIAKSRRHRISVLRGGFEALRVQAERPGELPFALTSITSDNATARRLLTAGIPGLPCYSLAGEFSTFALRPRPCRIAANIAPARTEDLPMLAAFLNRQNTHYQFSAHWSVDDLMALHRCGLRLENILLMRANGRIHGSIAVWDQMAFRQTVIQRYPDVVRRLRPLINVIAPLTGLPHLPQTGVALRQATFALLAVEDDDAHLFGALLAAALDQACARGLEVAMAGFATARSWRHHLLKHYRTMEYRTSLYLAHWPEAAPAVAALTPRMVHPELGLL